MLKAITQIVILEGCYHMSPKLPRIKTISKDQLWKKLKNLSRNLISSMFI